MFFEIKPLKAEVNRNKKNALNKQLSMIFG